VWTQRLQANTRGGATGCLHLHPAWRNGQWHIPHSTHSTAGPAAFSFTLTNPKTTIASAAALLLLRCVSRVSERWLHACWRCAAVRCAVRRCGGAGGGHRELICMHSGIVNRNRSPGPRPLYILIQALPAHAVFAKYSLDIARSTSRKPFGQAVPGSECRAAAVRGVNFRLLVRGGRMPAAACCRPAALLGRRPAGRRRPRPCSS
jgi:hypothetical protein